METIESVRTAGALSVSRTMAPGSGREGATEMREVCAPSEPETNVNSATAALTQVLTVVRVWKECRAS